MSAFVLALEGMDDLGPIETLGADIKRWLRISVNETARFARRQSKNEILKQVNFPGNYLDDLPNRFWIAKWASENDPEAVIAARHRATSLARFVTGPTVRKQGVTISMKNGQTSHLQRGFLMKLKSGKASIDSVSNLGLAVRTAPGEKPAAAYKPVEIKSMPGVWLLYGASVDQVFKSVRQDVSPEAAAYAAREFRRLMDAKV